MTALAASLAPAVGPSLRAGPPSRPRLALVDPRLRRNRILQALADDTWSRVSSQLQLIECRTGTILEEPGVPAPYIYFPADAVVSLLCVTHDGAASEVARVGPEGVVGISQILGGPATSNRAVVQSGGHAFRAQAEGIRMEFKNGGCMQRLLLRYTQSLLTQMGQAAVCNRRHSLHQQLCRYLLTSIDRAVSNTLAITHERIAAMLGVRREGVTECAGQLQRLGAIHCSRGHIAVLDRAVLEANACECYGVLRDESHGLQAAI
jgi:CRP-like cAMP-binding protein